jgi:DNA-directed RNA polymerase specialized sigma24 family protein
MVNQIEKTNSLLRALLRITLEQSEDITVGRKVEVLDSAGLRPLEIAQILGTTPNAVSSLLYKAKKKKGLETEQEKPTTTQPSTPTS